MKTYEVKFVTYKETVKVIVPVDYDINDCEDIDDFDNMIVEDAIRIHMAQGNENPHTPNARIYVNPRQIAVDFDDPQTDWHFAFDMISQNADIASTYWSKADVEGIVQDKKNNDDQIYDGINTEVFAKRLWNHPQFRRMFIERVVELGNEVLHDLLDDGMVAREIVIDMQVKGK